MRALIFVAILALAGCTAPEPTQDLGPVGQIDGAVVNHVLVPFGNVTVRLVDMDRTTQTTELGGFSFFDVPVGFHTVAVELPGIGSDRQVVSVDEEGDVAKMILQIIPVPEDEPHDTVLSNTKILQFAEPGAECESCTWRTQLQRGDGPLVLPDSIDMEVDWDGRHPVGMFETHMIVEMRDQDGKRVLGPFDKDDVVHEEGRYLIRASLPKADIPEDATSLTMHFQFDPDNELMHPDFEMERRVTLHYGDGHD